MSYFNTRLKASVESTSGRNIRSNRGPQQGTRPTKRNPRFHAKIINDDHRGRVDQNGSCVTRQPHPERGDWLRNGQLQFFIHN